MSSCATRTHVFLCHNKNPPILFQFEVCDTLSQRHKVPTPGLACENIIIYIGFQSSTDVDKTNIISIIYNESKQCHLIVELWKSIVVLGAVLVPICQCRSHAGPINEVDYLATCRAYSVAKSGLSVIPIGNLPLAIHFRVLNPAVLGASHCLARRLKCLAPYAPHLLQYTRPT